MVKKSKGILTLILVIITALVFGTAGVYAGTSVQKIQAYLNYGIKFKVNGETWTPKDADGKVLSPVIYNGSSYLPTKALAEALGAKIDWDGATTTIIIESNVADTQAGIPYKDDNTYSSDQQDKDIHHPILRDSIKQIIKQNTGPADRVERIYNLLTKYKQTTKNDRIDKQLARIIELREKLKNNKSDGAAQDIDQSLNDIADTVPDDLIDSTSTITPAPTPTPAPTLTTDNVQ